MNTLAPFQPTDAELAHEIARQYLNEAKDIAHLRLVLETRGSSGSDWGIKEVNAVRAIPLINLDPKRLIPGKFFPKDDDEVFSSLRRDIQAASIDDLKDFQTARFNGNEYDMFFFHLSELCTAQTTEADYRKEHRRNTSDSSTDTDRSSSSNEATQEKATSVALTAFVAKTVMSMGHYTYLPSNRDVARPYLRHFSAESRFQWEMGGAQYEVYNNGSIGVNRPGKYSRSDRRSEIPVVNLECKSRHAGGIKRGSGEPAKFVPLIFAQEVAELIGTMQKQQNFASVHPDQESFVISLHGTLFHMTAAYFSPQYIDYLRRAGGAPTAINEPFLYVRQSVNFDMKDPQHRQEALRCVWALVRYIASGEARVNIVTAIINAASD